MNCGLQYDEVDGDERVLNYQLKYVNCIYKKVLIYTTFLRETRIDLCL